MNYYLGIDLGGTNIAAGVVDDACKIVGHASIATGRGRSVEAILADILRAADLAVQHAGLHMRDISSAGIGAPSSIDPKTRRIVFANNLGWRDVDLVGPLERHMSKPVQIGNDADCAALAESVAGPAKNYSNILMLTIGTGVGGSLIINKKIFSGGNGYGCEPGHTLFIHGGALCTCGRHGCLEAYISATALIHQTVQALWSCPESLIGELCGQDWQKIDGHTAFDAAKAEDPTGIRVVETYIDYLAEGISGLVSLLRPEAVIIGGGICNEGEYLLAPVRQKVRRSIYGAGQVPPPAILKAVLGNDAGVIGAALLAKQSR